MSYASEYLAEVTANDGTSEVVLRYSMSGYTTRPSDDPPNAYYADFLDKPGGFDRSLFAPGRTMGRSQCDFGMVVLANTTGELNDLVDYAFDGRPFTLKRLASKYASFESAEVVLRATMDGIETTDGQKELTVRIYDRRLELERTIQTNLYSGTTTSGGLVGNLDNGNGDVKNQPKPLTFGICKNVTPVLVNPYDRIYQVSDGAVVAIAAFDGGVPLINVGDFATVALLQANAGTLKFPKYGTCLAAGLFMVFGSTNYPITCNVTEGTDYTAADLVERVLAWAGLSGSANIDAASFAALAALRTDAVGVYVDDARQIIEVVDEVLRSVGGWIVPNLTGQFTVGAMVAPSGSPDWTIVDQQIAGEAMSFGLNPDFDKNLPVWRVVVRWGRNYTVMAETDIAGSVCEDVRSFLVAEWREAKAEDAEVLDLHPQAPELVIETALTTQEDAEAEAVRLLAMYGIDRQVLRATLPREEATDVGMGTEGNIAVDALGFAAGRDMVCIGRAENHNEESVTLTLWG